MHERLFCRRANALTSRRAFGYTHLCNIYQRANTYDVGLCLSEAGTLTSASDAN
jgi:hypothetical protein